MYKLFNSTVPTSYNSIVPTSWRVQSVHCIRLTINTSWRVRSVQQYIRLRRVHSVVLTYELASPPRLSSYICGLGGSSLGGCDTEAKSHINTQGRDTQIIVHNQITPHRKYTRTRANTEKRYIFVPSLQCGRRRCSRVSLLLLLPSSPCLSVSSGYEMQAQSIMEGRHWPYLALFLVKSADLCGSARLISL